MSTSARSTSVTCGKIRIGTPVAATTTAHTTSSPANGARNQSADRNHDSRPRAARGTRAARNLGAVPVPFTVPLSGPLSVPLSGPALAWRRSSGGARGHGGVAAVGEVGADAGGVRDLREVGEQFRPLGHHRGDRAGEEPVGYL